MTCQVSELLCAVSRKIGMDHAQNAGLSCAGETGRQEFLSLHVCLRVQGVMLALCYSIDDFSGLDSIVMRQCEHL